MTNYFNLLPTDLQIVIMNKIFDKFKMIYQTYKVHPTHLKYNGSSSYISFYNNYYVKNDQLPTAKYANTGDIVIDISYSQYHNSHILYEVRGFYNYEYLTNYRTMRCNYHKIIQYIKKAAHTHDTNTKTRKRTPTQKPTTTNGACTYHVNSQGTAQS